MLWMFSVVIIGTFFYCIIFILISLFTHFSYREAVPLFRVWKSFQGFIRAEVPHEGSHWGKALPLHRVWKELQEVVAAFNPSEGKALYCARN